MTLHTKLSYAKSCLRIVGYLVLMTYNDTPLTIAAICLLIAEFIGIAEELPGSYKGQGGRRD